jgi:hypothetical protein
MADALEAALPYLWDGEAGGDLRRGCIYICNALDRVADKSNGAEMAQREISRRLRCSTVSTWLKFHGHASPDSLRSDPTIQAYRRRWMLALIEEFRK